LPTIAELTGAKLPPAKIDGRSFAKQSQGMPEKPRDWIYMQLEEKRYARNARWKLTGDGKLFDMSEAPFQELSVPAVATDPKAVVARKQLQAVVDDVRSQEGGLVRCFARYAENMRFI